VIEHVDALPDGAWEQLAGGEDHPFGIDEFEWRKKDWHTLLRDGDGRAVACAGLTLADVEVGEEHFEVVGVGDVIVTPARRGEGLLRPVLDAALERAATLGPDKAMLFCSEQRARMYARFGFVEVRTPVVAGGQAMRERFMWRPLRAGATWPEGPVTLPRLPF
jgi:predicted GNAT family N-acyltransferase